MGGDGRDKGEEVTGEIVGRVGGPVDPESLDSAMARMFAHHGDPRFYF